MSTFYYAMFEVLSTYYSGGAYEIGELEFYAGATKIPTTNLTVLSAPVAQSGWTIDRTFDGNRMVGYCAAPGQLTLNIRIKSTVPFDSIKLYNDAEGSCAISQLKVYFMNNSTDPLQTDVGWKLCHSNLNSDGTQLPYGLSTVSILVPRAKILIKTENKDLYTYSSSWTKVGTEPLSEIDKKNLFISAGMDSLPNSTILKQLALVFDILRYVDEPSTPASTLMITAVPYKFFIKPETLISLASFEGIDNASVTSTISGTGACHILVTTDLVNYKTWNGTSWAIVDTSDLSAISSNGLTPSMLNAVPRSGWDALTGGKGSIAFGYLPTIELVTDSAAVDNLTFIVDMKGSWDKAVHGIDYGYGYPQNNILKVTLKTNGDYKINYSEGA